MIYAKLMVGAAVVVMAVSIGTPARAPAQASTLNKSVAADGSDLSAQRRGGIARAGRRGGGGIRGGGRAFRGGGAVRRGGGGAVRRGGVAVRGGAVRRGGIVRGGVVRRPVRGWVRRPYYGTIIGGVALGTIIAATAIGSAPAAPGPNMCWYWADSSRARGYWDYCTPP